MCRPEFMAFSLAAGSDHDIRPHGLRLHPADRRVSKPPRELVATERPRSSDSESDVHVGGWDVATTLDDRKVVRVSQLFVILASRC